MRGIKKIMFYPKLALSGMMKTRKLYLPYILTCIGMVMMYYLLAFLSTAKSVAVISGGAPMQTILVMGTGVVLVFATIFLFYTNSFLIRRRKKEFGLYNILGMSKTNLARILFWESVMIAVSALVTGLTGGIVFSKFAELCLINLMKSEAKFTFYVEMPVVLGTMRNFSVIFILIFLSSLWQMHKTKPVELLKSENVGEKPPKANWLIAIFGFALLGVAYWIAVTIENPLSALLYFFAAVVMVIISTYILFISGSVFICRILKKNKRYYYKAEHFVSVSSMAYRMKRNGAGLASICILSTAVLVMLSSTTCLYVGIEDSLRIRHPRNIVVDIYSADEAWLTRTEEAVEEVLDKYEEESKDVMKYRILDFSAYMDGSRGIFDPNELDTFSLFTYDSVYQIFIVPVEDYNRLMGEDEVLKPGEAILYVTKSNFAEEVIYFDDMEPFHIKKKVDKFVDNGVDAMQIIPSLYLFVSDFDERAKASEGIVVDTVEAVREHGYYGFDLSCSDEKQIEIYDELKEVFRQWSLEDSENPHISSESVAVNRNDFYGLYGGLFFLGILLGLVCIFAEILIIYYKQISEGYEDQSRFDIMEKVGMTKKEIKKSINSQILTVFLLPLVAAGVHMIFAFPLIYQILELFSANRELLIGTTAICYLVFVIFYIIVYLITSRAYYRIVSSTEK